MSRSHATQQPIVLVTSSAAIHHPRMYHLMARALAQAGLRVIVVGQDDTLGAIPGIEEYVLPRRRRRITRMLSAPITMARVWALRPAAVGVHSLDLLPWAVLLRGVGRVPVTYDSNEDYAAFMLVKEWLPQFLRRPVSRLVGALEPWLAGRLDGTTVADQPTQEAFACRGVHALLVRNFAWRAMSETTPEEEPAYDVLYHGTLPPYYADQIIDTAQLLRDRGERLRWCVAIRNSADTDTDDLERRLERAGLRETFTLLHDRPFGEMPALIAQSRMGFVPWPDQEKFRRNFPRKVFELMAVGRPAVVSDLPSTRSLLGGLDCCVLSPPEDTAAYADAIQTLVDDATRRDRIGETGRRLVRERFNADAEMRPYVALYRRLTASGRRGGRE